MTNPQINLASLQLTFDDEFNAFNASPGGLTGWSTSYPWEGDAARTVVTNHEAEYYSDSSVGANPFSVSNGVLSITAAPAAAGTADGLAYTSGVITSYHSFAQLYGYFEIRAELPAGQGLWPAFWMLPADGTDAAELDVMEQLGNNPTTIYSTVHDNVAGSTDGGTNVVTTANATTGFHTYGVDWEPNTITFYVDGQITATMPTPAAMDKPMYMIADLAVGGPGSWPGAPGTATVFPATLQIDAIRAYATAATIDVSGTAAITTGAVSGQVQLAGVAQAGVVVSLVNAVGVVVATATTDGNGNVAFTGIQNGAYQLDYTLAGGQSLVAAAPISNGQTTSIAAGSFVAAASFSGSVVYAGAGLGGVTVTLVNAAGAIVATTTSAATGAYGFGALLPGSYQIGFTAPAGKLLQPGSQATIGTGLTAAVSIAAGQSLALPAETLVAASSVSGSVLLNGTTASVGTAISLLNAAGTMMATTTTSSTGAYSFGNLQTGLYQLQFVAPAGQCLQSGSLATMSTGLTAPLNLAVGQNLVLAADGMLTNPASASGTVHHFGAAGDPSWGSGQGGVTVSLVNSAGTVIDSTVTADTGWFIFYNLGAGSYQYCFTPPAGLALQAGGIANTTTGLTAAFSVTAGQAFMGPTAAVMSSGAITGQVVLSGAGEAGLVVTLLGAGGASIATATSNAAGSFAFNNLAGGTYQLRYAAPTNQLLSPTGAANATTGLSAPVTLTPGQTVALGAETLIPAPAAIVGNVVSNGVANAGASVSLLDSTGRVIATASTNAAGYYGFGGLSAGSYQVSFVTPHGLTLQAGGFANGQGLSAAVVVAAGQTLILAAENMLSNPGSIQGAVHHYGSADISWGSGQSGVTIALLNASGTAIATTVSDGHGYFFLGGLVAGSYQLQYSAPTGEALTTGANVNTTTGVTSPIVVAAGQNVTAATAGVVSSSNTFTLTGTNAAALRGNGNYSVTGAASNSVLTLGAGNQTVVLTGTGNHVTIGAGTSSVNPGSGGAVVHAAGGNVSITAGGANNLFDSGTGIGFLNADGSAGNKFMLNATGQGLTTITGFSPATTDVLDLARTLAGTNILPSLANVGLYVTSAVSGGNTTLYVDPTGTHAHPVAFAALSGVNTSVAALLSGGHFSLN